MKRAFRIGSLKHLNNGMMGGGDDSTLKKLSLRQPKKS